MLFYHCYIAIIMERGLYNFFKCRVALEVFGDQYQ